MHDYPRLPPGQQLVAPGKWPTIGERTPAPTDQPWGLTLSGSLHKRDTLSLEQLREFPQTKMTIDIHCVTRWSKLAVEFSGVLLADLLPRFVPSPNAKFISFISRSERNHSSTLSIATALSQQTLIALDVDGKPLGIDHGGPIRNIVPGRYFYKSVKWVTEIELLVQDRLGFWESESGYHNLADPWLEQRYLAPTIDRRTAAILIDSKDFSNQNLLSLSAANRDLQNLNARSAMLRNADFSHSDLRHANFAAANLSNAHLRNADLRNAIFLNADLEGADFTGADLRGTDFTGCSLIGASFFDVSSGNVGGAQFDSSTNMPSEVLTPLLPKQRDFVNDRLAQSL